MKNDQYWLNKQKPCPNCRGEGRIVRETFEDGDVWYRPECNCCLLGWQENYPTVKEAVEAWNGAGELIIYTDPNWRPESEATDE